MQRYKVQPGFPEVTITVKMGTANNLPAKEIASIIDGAICFYMEEGYYRDNGKKVDFTMEVSYEEEGNEEGSDEGQ